MGIWTLTCLLTIVIGTAGLIISVSYLLQTNPRIAERIQQFANENTGAVQIQALAGPGDEFDKPDTYIFQPFQRQSERLKKRLAAGGFYAANADVTFCLGQAIAAGTLMVIFGAAASFLPVTVTVKSLAALSGGLLGILIPVFWLNNRTRSRRNDLARELPDMLDLIVSCLDAGVTLEAIVLRISKDELFERGALAEEIRRIQGDVDLGFTIDQAFEAMAERCDSDEMRSISTVCLQSRKYGARIGETLRSQADTMRYAREQAAEEAAMKASVRILAPTLLFLFPVIFVVLAGPASIQVYEKLADTESASE